MIFSRSNVLSDRFQSEDAVDDGGGEDGMGGNKFAAFAELVLRYIVDGAPDEVNIRYSTYIGRHQVQYICRSTSGTGYVDPNEANIRYSEH